VVSFKCRNEGFAACLQRDNLGRCHGGQGLPAPGNHRDGSEDRHEPHPMTRADHWITSRTALSLLPVRGHETLSFWQA